MLINDGAMTNLPTWKSGFLSKNVSTCWAWTLYFHVELCRPIQKANFQNGLPAYSATPIKGHNPGQNKKKEI